MKVELKAGYVAVIAPRAAKWAGRLASGRSEARAWAIVPGVIVFRNEEQMIPWVINHEKIHFRQTLELLIIGAWLLWLGEFIWARLILRKTAQEAYQWSSGEQEAYRNQQNFEYLKNRKRFAQLRYLTHKREFTFGNPGEIIYLNHDAI